MTVARLGVALVCGAACGSAPEDIATEPGTVGGSPTSTSGEASDSSGQTGQTPPPPVDLPDCYNPGEPSRAVVSLAVDSEGAAYVVTVLEQSWCGPGYGYSCSPHVFRYDASGAMEETEIRVPTDHFDCRGVLAFAWGAVYVAGVNKVLRLGPEPAEALLAPLAAATSIALGPPGRTFVAWAYRDTDPGATGYFTNLGLYTADLDKTAELPLDAYGMPVAVAAGPFGGAVLAVDGAPPQLVRLADDLSVSWAVELERPIAAAAIDASGRVVAAGDDLDGPWVARWGADGALDPTFDGSALPNDEGRIFSLALDSAQAPYVAGSVEVGGEDASRLSALDPSGLQRWHIDFRRSDQLVSIEPSPHLDGFTETFVQLAPDGDVLLIASWAGTLVRVDPEGSVKWASPIEP